MLSCLCLLSDRIVGVYLYATGVPRWRLREGWPHQTPRFHKISPTFPFLCFCLQCGQQNLHPCMGLTGALPRSFSPSPSAQILLSPPLRFWDCRCGCLHPRVLCLSGSSLWCPYIFLCCLGMGFQSGSEPRPHRGGLDDLVRYWGTHSLVPESH